MLRKILITAVVIFLLFTAYKFARAKGFLSDKVFSPLETKLPKNIQLPKQNSFSQEDINKLGENGMAQVKILAEKAKEAGNIAQDFVQGAVKEDKGNDKNISEKALEYGKYIYCQEVVKQYEASKSANF